MKIVTIIGARPQFIKSVPVSRELVKKEITEIIIHTGQHFSKDMNDIFFDQLKIQKPDYFLNINKLSHGAMTGRMIEEIEIILLKEKPDYVILYGDTNSTLAGAIAASKLSVKIVHIEAGLRSFNMRMPEEVNRIITDRLSSFLFCPTDTAVKNLMDEGFNRFNCNIIKSGDVMLDALRLFTPFQIKPKIKVPDKFILCTIHREENTEDENILKSIFSALNSIAEEIEIILPLHPRTKKKIRELKLDVLLNDRVNIINPVGYLEMLYLLNNCTLVMTDSGGLQKEAFFLQRYCLTLRNETEWVELVNNGFNLICGTNTKFIVDCFNKSKALVSDFNIDLFGKGKAAQIIVDNLAI